MPAYSACPSSTLQFLPQDKVVEFARMKPVDLLEATEKVGGCGWMGWRVGGLAGGWVGVGGWVGGCGWVHEGRMHEDRARREWAMCTCGDG